MPQTNLYFFESIGLGVACFWLLGYALFYQFVVGRLMLVYKTRDYLRSLGVSAVFCPLTTIGESTYLETFLFTVEFGLLLGVVIGVVRSQLTEENIQIEFKLIPFQNTAANQQSELVTECQTVLNFFHHSRASLFYFTQRLNQVTFQTLNLICLPYQNQLLLTVYQRWARQPIADDLQLDD